MFPADKIVMCDAYIYSSGQNLI